MPAPARQPKPKTTPSPLLCYGMESNAPAAAIDRAAHAGFDAVAIDVAPASLDVAALRPALYSAAVAPIAQVALPRALHLPQRPEAARAWLGHALQRAEALGCRLMGGALAGAPGTLDDDPARAAALAAEVLDDLCAEANQRGITLCLQPLNRYESSWLRSPSEAVALLQVVDSPALRLQLDCYHLRVESAEPAEALGDAGALLALLRVPLPTGATQSGGARTPPWLKPIWAAMRDLDFGGAIVACDEPAADSVVQGARGVPSRAAVDLAGPGAGTSAAARAATASAALRLLRAGIRQMAPRTSTSAPARATPAAPGAATAPPSPASRSAKRKRPVRKPYKR
jgi:D-psicose/D-tagatose/L-ribulose 3-epimerase